MSTEWNPNESRIAAIENQLNELTESIGRQFSEVKTAISKSIEEALDRSADQTEIRTAKMEAELGARIRDVISSMRDVQHEVNLGVTKNENSIGWISKLTVLVIVTVLSLDRAASIGRAHA